MQKVNFNLNLSVYVWINNFMQTMNSQNFPKMSLVSQYDDLCRYTKVLTAGCENEFKTFVESQLTCVGKRKETEQLVEDLKKSITKLESEKGRLETQNKHIKSLWESAVEKSKKLEMEKNSMERQIALIREVLLSDGNALDNQTKEKLVKLSSACKLSSLTNIEESVGSLLNLSFDDNTDDELNAAVSYSKVKRSRGKRKSSEKKKASKRRKSEEEKHFSDDEFVIIDDPIPPFLPYRSNSDPASTSPPKPVIVKQVHRSDSEQIKYNTYDIKRDVSGSIFGSTPVGRYNSVGKLSRSHTFCTKTVFRGEKCHPCGRIIKFCKQALKCEDCKITCHPECKEQCPIPCIPAVHTPSKGNMGSIEDYTSNIPPMIPSLIVHCVNEIETRGLKEIGIYRVSGSEREVKDLKEKFLRGKTVPNLNLIDIHAICGTLKEFLRSLKEPLVPRSSWREFVNAANIPDTPKRLNTLYNAVCNIPQPNRDTLAFLVLHLQRVAASPECKMPTENLGKVFGPTIVGYSSEDLTDCNMLGETKYQCKVMQSLLSISADYWQNLLNFETDVFNPSHKTPTSVSGLSTSRKTPRTPLYSSNQKSKSGQVGRTPLSSRNARLKGTNKGKRQFFASPMI